MPWVTEAQVRAHAWLLSSASRPDGSDYTVPSAVITDRETQAETYVTGRLRAHYDTTAAAFQADATVIYVTGRFAAALCLEYAAQGTKNLTAKLLRKEVKEMLTAIEERRIALSVSRRTDAVEGENSASWCSTAEDTATFDPSGTAMQGF